VAIKTVIATIINGASFLWDTTHRI